MSCCLWETSPTKQLNLLNAAILRHRYRIEFRHCRPHATRGAHGLKGFIDFKFGETIHRRIVAKPVHRESKLCIPTGRGALVGYSGRAELSHCVTKPYQLFEP